MCLIASCLLLYLLCCCLPSQLLLLIPFLFPFFLTLSFPSLLCLSLSWLACRLVSTNSSQFLTISHNFNPHYWTSWLNRVTQQNDTTELQLWRKCLCFLKLLYWKLKIKRYLKEEEKKSKDFLLDGKKKATIHRPGTKWLLLDEGAYDILKVYHIPGLERTRGNQHFTVICSNNTVGGCWVVFPKLSSTVSPCGPNLSSGPPWSIWPLWNQAGVSKGSSERSDSFKLNSSIYIFCPATAGKTFFSKVECPCFSQSTSQGSGLLSSQVKKELLKRSLYAFLCLSFSLIK